MGKAAKCPGNGPILTSQRSKLASSAGGHVEPLEPGDPSWVGQYRIQGRLGSGGMGRVFLAKTPGNRKVAVKLIRPELAQDHDFRVRFAREVAAASKVSGAFTAPVIDFDLDAPQPWLVTSYIEGLSLADAVDTRGPFSADQVIDLAAGLAEGLRAIHAAGVVHRDLKPSNVLLASDGPRIIDFGIARAADSARLTGTSSIVGSPGFMSPEQARGRKCEPPSDVFSLGAVLAYAVTGESPFGSGTPDVLLFRVVHSQPDTDRIPAQLRPMVESCLAKDPQQRPTTGELLSACGELARSQRRGTPAEQPLQNPKAVSAAPPSAANGSIQDHPRSWTATGKRLVRRRWLLAACAIVILAGVAAGFMMTSAPLTDPPPPPTVTVSDSAPATVRAFFTAINNHDWQRVWSLGGRYLNRHSPHDTLRGMIFGYRCTKNDVITGLSSSGHDVSGYFVAHEALGGVKAMQYYEFSYFVSRGVIRGGRQHLLGGQPPPACAS
jgi:serine/threonine protein kinase